MNSAVKQLPRSFARAIGRWISLVSVLAAWPALGQGLPVEQPGDITINDATFVLGQHNPAKATPYPSVIGTSNLLGTLQKISVTLPNLTHTYAADVDILLVRTNDNARIVLVSDVGLNAPFSGVTLTIDDTASGSLPATGTITAGTFKATDIDAGSDPTPDSWPDVDPPNATLGDLEGTSPNGVWRLYVVDDKFNDVGTIGGWTVNLFTTPVITKLPPASVTNNEDAQFTVQFSVDDSDTPLDQLKLTAVSSDTNIVNNFSFTGTGTNRTLTFTPNANRNTGTNSIDVTIRVEDAISKDGDAVTATFAVHIVPVNDAPTLTLNANSVTTRQGTLTTNVLFAVVNDVDDDVNGLTLFATSSNTNLVVANHVFFDRGTAGTNLFAIAPRGAAIGDANLEIKVTDGKATNSVPFTFTATDISQAVFGTGFPIEIVDDASANPYPASVTVSNVTGNIGKITVTLADFNHGSPSDLDIVLRGPSGTNVILMGRAGGTPSVVNKRIVFDPDAATEIPEGSIAGAPLTTATYRPADYGSTTLPSPAPAGPYSADLTDFAGTNPNGTWSLFIQDRSTGDAGEIRGGFIITIYSAPVINGIADTVTTDEDTPITLEFSVADFDGVVTNVSFPTVSGFATGDAGVITGTNVSLKINPAANVSGTNNVTIVARDDNGYTSTRTFSLRIRSVNDNPTIETISRQTTYAGIPVQGITFGVGEVAGNETPVADLVVTAQSSNTKLLPESSIALGGSGATRTLSLFPIGNTAGSATVTLTVRDASSPAGTASTSFVLDVLGPASPLYLNPDAIIIQDSGPGNGVTNATPYPSTITVSNLVGTIQTVRVTLLGLQQPIADDLDILLVGPNGGRVILMGDAGGNNAVNNVQLLFDDDASDLLPDSGQIVSGTFRPSNYAPADTFPQAGSGTVSDSLGDAFAGASPNGTWSLYIVDDTGNTKGASLAGGWMINFETTPVISAIADQTTPEDTEKRVTVNIGNEQPGVPTTLTATSSATGIVANSGLTFEGSGATRTLRIVPVANATGETIITVTVTIGGTSVSEDFKLTITPVDDAPTIGDIANQSSPAGLILGPITFSVTDNETGNPATIVVTAISSDQNVIPNSNLVVRLDPNNSANRTITILPNGTQTGSATITITATDTGNPPQKGTKTFTAAFVRNLSFANGSRIEITDASASAAGTGIPYPSVIPVSGINGTVSKVSVTLRGYTHPFPDDVALLLVSPDNSKKVVLMSNAGGGAPSNSVSSLTLNFSDSGLTLTSEERLNYRSYKTASFGGVSTANGNFPGPAPAGPYGTTLGDFNGTNPNGDWKLYAIDDTLGDDGSIDGGWILVIETAPTILAIGNQTTQEDTPLQIPIFLSDQDTDGAHLTTTASASAQSTANLVNATNLVFSPTNTLERTLTIIPTANLNGTNLITVTVSDGSTSSSRSFGLTVTAVDDQPLVRAFPTNSVTIAEDSTTNIIFQVRDIDSTLFLTNTLVTSDNLTLVPTNGLALSGPLSVPAGEQEDYIVTIRPATNQVGSGVIYFSMRDGTTTTTRGLALTVTPVNDVPTISGLSNAVVSAGSTVRDIPFIIGDVETTARQLTVTATSSDQARIPNANIALSGGDATRFISLAATPGAAAGNVNITITVSDGTLSTSAILAVEVRAAPGDVYANSAAITIRDNNTAQPYPSIITIPANSLSGRISRISVGIEGFSHPAPDDVDILLVSPGGIKILLLSDAGGSVPVTGARVVFDDTASGTIPDNGPLLPGIFRASVYSPDDTFPNVAAPYSGRLSDLIGTNPNGDWRLYVLDDTAGQSGQIAQGWTLNIVTSPTLEVTSPSNLVLSQNEDQTATAQITFGDPDNSATPEGDLTLSFASTNPSLIPPSAPNVVAQKTSGSVGSGLNYNLNILPATNQPLSTIPATNVLTITVTRKGDGATASAVLTNVVNPVNDAPVISRITAKTTQENRPLTFTFVVSDVDTAPGDLTIIATSSNPTLIANTNISFANGSNSLPSLPSDTLQITLTPRPGQTGNATIFLAVDDKTTGDADQSATASFPFSVTEFNDPPAISQIPDISVPAGQSTTNIAFTVSDPDSGTVTLSASSSDQALVRNANIVISAPLSGAPGAHTVRITSEVGVTGTAIITINATDGTSPVTMTFPVTVVESRERVFTNTRALRINDNSTASDYPSIINVQGIVGDVSQVRVSLAGFAHSFPQDVDILLVSPGGQKALLLSDAGGGNAVTNISLTFDDTAAGALSQGGAITNGTFQPSNYEGAADPFASPAPGGPYATNLSTFIGTPANGQWSLYVVDDTTSDFGFINGGWSLSITTQPRIVGLQNETIPEDGTLRRAFTIVEEGFVPATFTFRTTSTNTAVIRPEDLSVTGSGTNYVLNGTPVANASGITEITVFAKNQAGQEVSAKFSLTVTAVNDAPFITEIADQVIFAGTKTQPIAFNYGDQETEQRNLLFSIASSNTQLIPTNNIDVLGGFLTIIPVGSQSGSSDITLTVTDADGLTAATTFTVTVRPSPNPLFANPAAITIADNTRANPYPSQLQVSGITSTVTRVVVTLAEVSHNFPGDLDILLVNPQGRKVLLMSDAGGSGRLDLTRLTFDDRASNSIPVTPTGPLEGGTYKPSNYNGGDADAFPAPAPAAPYASVLAEFNGSDPNGTWSLYVIDDGSPDAGVIAGGWLLSIFTTEPTISPVDNQTTDENVPLAVNFRVEDADTQATNLITTATTDNPGLFPSLITSGNGNDRTLTVSPRQDASGTGNVTISVTDGTSIAQTVFQVTVNAVNQAPRITGLPNQLATAANRASTNQFQVTDRETSSSNLVVAATIANSGLGSVSTGGSGENRTLVFQPNGTEGQTTISVTVSDGTLTTTNTTTITVGAAYLLTVSDIADVVMSANQTRVVNFTVTGPGGAAPVSPVITGTAAGTNLVSRITTAGSGTNFTATIFLIPNRSGTDSITITAADNFGTGSTTFGLTVLEVTPPVLGPIANQRTQVNQTLTLPLSVRDADTPITSLLYTWTATPNNLVRNIAFGLSQGTNVVATILPVQNATGTANVTISVDDGITKVSQSFALEIFRPTTQPPVLGPIADQTTNANHAVVINLTVTDSDTPLQALQFTSTTSNPGLVSGVTVDVSSGSAIASVALVPDATGLATVTITVSDGTSSDFKAFALLVLPEGGEPELNTPTISQVGGVTTITVTWSGGGELETAPSAVGPWTGTGNTSGTFSEPAAGAAKFYRVRR